MFNRCYLQHNSLVENDTIRVLRDVISGKNQFKRCTALFGKDCAFHRVLKDFLNSVLEGEMDNHLEATKPLNKDNRRNGKMSKEVQTEYGAINVETPRDREGLFFPEIVKKRQTILADVLSIR